MRLPCAIGTIRSRGETRGGFVHDDIFVFHAFLVFIDIAPDKPFALLHITIDALLAGGGKGKAVFGQGIYYAVGVAFKFGQKLGQRGRFCR